MAIGQCGGAAKVAGDRMQKQNTTGHIHDRRHKTGGVGVGLFRYHEGDGVGVAWRSSLQIHHLTSGASSLCHRLAHQNEGIWPKLIPLHCGKASNLPLVCALTAAF